jgi:hypothetical protein
MKACVKFLCIYIEQPTMYEPIPTKLHTLSELAAMRRLYYHIPARRYTGMYIPNTRITSQYQKTPETTIGIKIARAIKNFL